MRHCDALFLRKDTVRNLTCDRRRDGLYTDKDRHIFTTNLNTHVHVCVRGIKAKSMKGRTQTT